MLKTVIKGSKMNNDMKCPFCGQKMLRRNGPPSKVGVWQCQNYNDPDNVCIASGYLFNDDVLNCINRTRKALDVAKLILKNLLPDLDGYERLDVEKAIAEITALEQKDK